MVKIIIYAGLSVPFDEAKEILDSCENIEVIYKRPIQRGDLATDIPLQWAKRFLGFVQMRRMSWLRW